MKCEYGCDQRAIYKLKNGKNCCSKTYASCPEVRRKNSEKIKQRHKDGLVPGWNELREKYNISTTWNKDLTKETDVRVAKITNKNKERIEKEGHNWKGKKHSKKTKRKLSEQRIKYLENNKKLCEWYDVDGVKVQGKWEKRVAEWLLSKNLKFERKRLKYKGHRIYIVDFYIRKLNIYIEVKGFMRERDKRKMFLVLDEHDIDLRIIDSEVYNNLNEYEIKDLPIFKEKYNESDIDFSKFNDVWASDGNGIPC